MESKKPSLLIVDDEQDTCANLSDIFTELGYQVATANDGPGALELIDRQAYDVALLDLKMPGMNGLELYREVRRRSADTVAIIVTAFGGSETAKSALDAGAWRIVPKPVKLPDLLGFVDEATSQPLVMIVDDDHDLCHSMWDLLREQGYRVALAHDLGSSAKYLQRQTPQVVLIDMKLPDADGSRVLEVVRDLNPAARTLIITGFAGELDEPLARVLANGADAVCYKPFNVPQLLGTIQRLAAMSKPQ
jgi:CheY-like chemotaxis protein